METPIRLFPDMCKAIGILWVVSIGGYYISTLIKADSSGSPGGLFLVIIKSGLTTEKIVFLLILILYGALAEEFIFRFIPLGLAGLLGKELVYLIPISLFASAFFGYLHGGLFYIAIQGAAGVIHCLFFQRVKNSSGKAGVLYGLMFTTFAHFGFNVSVATLVFILMHFSK